MIKLLERVSVYNTYLCLKQNNNKNHASKERTKSPKNMHATDCVATYQTHFKHIRQINSIVLIIIKWICGIPLLPMQWAFISFNFRFCITGQWDLYAVHGPGDGYQVWPSRKYVFCRLAAHYYTFLFDVMAGEKKNINDSYSSQFAVNLYGTKVLHIFPQIASHVLKAWKQV